MIILVIVDEGYKVYTKVLEAKDYGTPQLRKRLFFVGIRKDFDVEFTFPEPVNLNLLLAPLWDFIFAFAIFFSPFYCYLSFLGAKTIIKLLPSIKGFFSITPTAAVTSANLSITAWPTWT